jgi:hypothetical protein
MVQDAFEAFEAAAVAGRPGVMESRCKSQPPPRIIKILTDGLSQALIELRKRCTRIVPTPPPNDLSPLTDVPHCHAQPTIQPERPRARLVKCPLNKKADIAVAQFIGVRERLFQMLDHLTALF